MKTNWEDLSKKLGVLQANGSELYTGQSMEAIEEILGDEWIEDAIDCFIEGRKGNELAIKTLRRISSNEAARYAYSIFLENKESDTRKAVLALFAISDIRMPICMDYVEQCIGDPRYEHIALGIFRNLIFESVLVYDELRLRHIANSFDNIYNDDVSPLREYISKEFLVYNR